MANTKDLRQTILECAQRATEQEPTDVELRLHAFVANMYARMVPIGELMVADVMWQLFFAKPPAPPVSEAAPPLDRCMH